MQAVPPVDYPSIIIGDTLYFAKFSLGSMYRLEGYGYSTANWKETVQAEIEAGRNIRLTCCMAAACLGIVEKGRWKPAGFTPEELADSIGNAEDLSRVVREAMEKAPRAPAAEPTEVKTAA